jgi:hypothetical protein
VGWLHTHKRTTGYSGTFPSHGPRPERAVVIGYGQTDDGLRALSCVPLSIYLLLGINRPLLSTDPNKQAETRAGASSGSNHEHGHHQQRAARRVFRLDLVRTYACMDVDLGLGGCHHTP